MKIKPVLVASYVDDFRLIFPGPPFVFGALLVILALMVAAFIPEAASDRHHSGGGSHSGSHGGGGSQGGGGGGSHHHSHGESGGSSEKLSEKLSRRHYQYTGNNMSLDNVYWGVGKTFSVSFFKLFQTLARSKACYILQGALMCFSGLQKKKSDEEKSSDDEYDPLMVTVESTSIGIHNTSSASSNGAL